MPSKYGVILLDGFEVVIQVYEKSDKWDLIHSQTRDLSSFKIGRFPKAAEYIEVLAQTALSEQALGIERWNIIARNLSETIIHQISIDTGLKIENLTLVKEQELLFKGILSEIKP